jgi:hypothetical protein
MLDWLSPLVMVVGVVGLGFLFTLAARARAARRAHEQPDPREAIARLRDMGRRDEIATLQSECVETARRLAAQLDTRLCALERLLAEADQRIDELRTWARRGTPQAGAEGPLESGPAPVRSPAPAVSPLEESVGALADTGLDAVEIARRLGEHTGTVQFILALRRQRAVAAPPATESRR